MKGYNLFEDKRDFVIHTISLLLFPVKRGYRIRKNLKFRGNSIIHGKRA